MKIIALSDTHGLYDCIKEVPNGDVLVFAGDATKYGHSYEFANFIKWLEKFPHLHKIIIAGNHDRNIAASRTLAEAHLANNGIIYLQDEEVIIEGVKFYGSPWTPEYYNWAFMLPRGEALKAKWNQIPRDTDVLITHGPPYSILDTRRDTTVQTGCEALFDVVKTLPLKAHIFGHIHECHGQKDHYYNVAICNRDYQPVNPVTEIEI